ncbi:hypothetical protein [Massilia sp. BSC265]|uniref:hypothetical protein n=1 Tax=Massilia sp. BSC265 TaxID=1549812 RepID=UPI001269C143|nr:hypothetical protein [Massilia sp. BSC265]
MLFSVMISSFFAKHQLKSRNKMFYFYSSATNGEIGTERMTLSWGRRVISGNARNDKRPRSDRWRFEDRVEYLAAG